MGRRAAKRERIKCQLPFPSKAGNRKAQRRPGFVRDFEGSRTGSSKLLGLGARRELQP